MAAPKNTPKDAQVMAAILKEIGIVEYEPRVINQMLEFTYRYVSGILDDANRFSAHAKKSAIDIDDVKLAIKLQTDRCFTTPPLREVLVDIAVQKNSTPLPLIKSTAGPRLPPDRYSLTACNYRLKSSSKKQRMIQSSRYSSSQRQPTSMNKLGPQVTLNNKSGGSVSVVAKAGNPSIPIMPRGLPSPAMPKNFPTPIVKLPDDKQGIRTPIMAPAIQPSVSNTIPTPQIMVSSNVLKRDLQPEIGEKRKREDMDDYEL